MMFTQTPRYDEHQQLEIRVFFREVSNYYNLKEKCPSENVFLIEKNEIKNRVN